VILWLAEAPAHMFLAGGAGDDLPFVAQKPAKCLRWQTGLHHARCLGEAAKGKSKSLGVGLQVLVAAGPLAERLLKTDDMVANHAV